MKTIFKNAILGTALAASAAVGMLAVTSPAEARPWGGYYGRGGPGVAVAAGVIGLAAGAAIAANEGPYYAPGPVGYYPPVAYGGPAPCYSAYPGYGGYCYPPSYYTNLGWGWHDGGWWYGGARYARPFAIGGYRGGYGYHGGYAGGYHGGYAGGYHGGYGGGAHAGYGGGGHGGGGHR